MIHDFSHNVFGNALYNSGASWSPCGAVRNNDFIKVKNRYFKVIEAKPCGDPWDMSFVKKYVSIADAEPGETITEKILEKEYNEVKNTHQVYSFPLDPEC